MLTRDEIETVYHGWIQALNGRNLTSDCLADTILHDEKELTKEQYIGHVSDCLEMVSGHAIEIDMVTIDVTTQAIAVRLIHRGTLQRAYADVPVTGKEMEWTEFALTWFNEDGKIGRVQSLVDMDALRAGEPRITRTPGLKLAPPPVGFDIKAMYRGYLATVNAAKVEDLVRYCAPVVTHNLIVSTLDEYRSFIENGPRQVENLKLTLLELITDDISQHVAARIVLTGKPVGEWFGQKPTGREVRFMEHAFYKLDGGKIAYLWARRDFDTFKKCLEGEL